MGATRTLLGWAPATNKGSWHRWERYPDGSRRAACSPYLEPISEPVPEEHAGKQCGACRHALKHRPLFGSVLAAIEQLVEPTSEQEQSDAGE